MRTSILFITLIAVVSATVTASDAPLRMQRKIAKRGDCVTCHRAIIPTETNTAMELRKETFHNETLLCQYQSVAKGGSSDGDEGDQNGDERGENELEPKEEEDVEDEDEEDNDREEDSEDNEDDEQEDEEDEKEDDNDEDEDEDDGDEEKKGEHGDEDEEDEDEQDEEECDPNDKFEKRAHLHGAQDLRGRDDDSEQLDGYTVEYDCVYDVASGNLLKDQARSCPPVVSSSC